MTSLVPLSASALLIATIITAATRGILASPWSRGALFVAAFALSLLPIGPLPLTHYARVLTGDLSMVTIILLGVFAGSSVYGKPLSAPLFRQFPVLAGLVVLSAFILYPSALGATFFDTYGAGYYPVTIGPVLLSVFIIATWRGQYLISVAVVAGFAGYVFRLLESDNLWDYLLDPVLTAISLTCVVTRRHALRRLEITGQDLTFAVATFGLSILGFAIFLGHLNPDGLQYRLAREDSFLGACTLVALLLAFTVCLRRLAHLHREHAPSFLIGTAAVGLTSLIAVLVLLSQYPGIPIFIVAPAMGLYLLLTTVLYRYGNAVPARYGIPVPALSQIAGYLLAVGITWLFIEFRQAEFMTFGLALVWFLLVAAPANDEIFMKAEGPTLTP